MCVIKSFIIRTFPPFVKLEDVRTQDFYEYWQNALLQRCCRLFEWEGLPDTIPQREIEMRLFGGICGIKNIYGEFFAVNATMSKVYRYWDVPTKFDWSTPTDSGEANVDRENFLIFSNSLHTSMTSLVQRYAVLLAHADMTLLDSFVLSREFNGVPTALTLQDAENIKSYRNALFDGEFMPLMDRSMQGVTWQRTDGKQLDIKAYYDVIEAILRDFYSDIGVKTTRYKRANMTSTEVDGDETMLLFNINDMLKCRQDGAKLLTRALNVDVSVRVAEPLMYSERGAENETLSQTDV